MFIYQFIFATVILFYFFSNAIIVTKRLQCTNTVLNHKVHLQLNQRVSTNKFYLSPCRSSAVVNISLSGRVNNE